MHRIRLAPPLHATADGCLERTQLLGRLNHRSSASIVWVHAPAGYGKTTLLAQWAAQTSIPLAWLTFDDAANEADRCAEMIGAVTSSFVPDADLAAPASLDKLAALQASIECAIESIGQFSTTVALVLDELDRIVDPATVTAIAGLIDQRPPNLRVLLSSRGRLDLPLARWRVQSQLFEIDARQLALTPSETAAVLETDLDPALASRMAPDVFRITVGWAAGVGLARSYLLQTVAMGRSPSEVELESTLNRNAAEFFIDEVVNRQRPDLIDFLLKSSILDQMTVRACVEIFGFIWSQKWLLELEHAGLFLTRAEGAVPVWSYHPLFADALRQAFETRDGAAAVAAAHGAARDWFARDGQLARALHHALLAGDATRTRELVIASAPALTQSGEIGPLVTLLAAIPADTIEDAGELRYWRTMVLMKTGDYETLSTELPLLTSIWGGSADPLLMTRLASMRAAQQWYAGQYGAAVATADLALTTGSDLPNPERSLATVTKLGGLILSGAIGDADRMLRSITSIDSTGELTLRCWEAEIALAQCEAHIAAAVLRRALDQFSSHVSHAYLGCLLILVDITRNWGDSAGAYALMKQADAYERALPHRLLRWQLENMWSLLAAAREDWATALTHATAMVRELPARCAPERQRYAAIWYAWASAQQGDCGPMRSVLERESPLVEQRLWDVPGGLIRAAMLSTTGDDEGAIHLLSGLCARAAADGRAYDVFRSSILEAIIYEHANDRGAALVSLQRAIPLARRSGFRQPFLRHGATMRDLLRALPNHQGARQVLSWMDETGSPRVDVLTTALTTPELIHALTSREVEILRLVELGLSNEEIGTALGITVPTVKRHLTNLFAKLGARNRTEATFQLRRRNLAYDAMSI